MYCVKKSLHERCLIKAVHSSGTLVALSLTLTMDFSNLWNLSYELTDASLHTV